MVDGIMDIDILEKYPEVYKIMREYPFDFLYDFLEQGMTYEKNGNLKNRWDKYYKEMQHIIETLNITFSDSTNTFSSKWADYMLYRNLDINLINMYVAKQSFLEQNITIEGKYIIDGYLKEGIPPIIVSIHMNAYQGIIPILASYKYDISYFMDRNTVETWNSIGNSLAPQIMSKLYPIGLPDKSAIRQAIINLKNGIPLLMFPEFSLGSTPNITTKFYGKRVYVPEGPAKLALSLNLPIIPLLFYKTGRYNYSLLFYEPIYKPGDILNMDDILLNMFKWIEVEVKKRPENWWCWYIFQEKMLAPEEK